MKLPALVFVWLVLLAGCSGGDDSNGEFREGQAWNYHARPGEEDSVLVIGRIERLNGNVVYHIQVQGISIAGPQGEVTRIGHLPVSEGALRQSVTEPAEGALDASVFEQGYEQWAASDGGVFTVPVVELVEMAARLNR